MSRSVNRVQLLGRIGRDAETKQTTADIAVSNFTLATNRSVKSATGYKQQTDWHNIVVWRSENLGPYLTKGKLVVLARWVRRRLRSAMWKQWKRGPVRFGELYKRGGVETWPRKRRAALMVRGGSPAARRWLWRCPMLTSTGWAFRD